MGHSAVVLGASGFSGGEVVRLLAAHPAIDVTAVAAERRAGEPIGSVHPHLAHLDLRLVPAAEAASFAADICFSCLPLGELPSLVPSITAKAVVDISGDHREPGSGWVYGLTEFARSEVKDATRVANPGCYPTAVLLALVPFLEVGAIEPPVIVDAMSGVSGAGRKADDRLLFSVASGDVAAYGTTTHRHVPEMEAGLSAFGGAEVNVSFTPHLVPMARGLLVTARARLVSEITDDEAHLILSEAYRDEPFVHAIRQWPGAKAATGSNHAFVSAHVDGRNGWLIASASIDNLGKGAAGQAIQNANLMLGLEETAGLDAMGVWP